MTIPLRMRPDLPPRAAVADEFNPYIDACAGLWTSAFCGPQPERKRRRAPSSSLGAHACLPCQRAALQDIKKRLARRAERMLGGGGEADDDAVAVVHARQRMAHHRQPVDGDPRLARPAQHLDGI